MPNHLLRINSRRILYSFLPVLPLLVLLSASAPAQTTYSYRHAIDDPLGQQKSPVYEIYGQYAVRGSKIHIASLRVMFDIGITQVAHMDNVSQAWRCFIHDDDIIALKFTRTASRQISTNQDVAAALLECLYQAGFKPENIMLVGLDDLPSQAQGTRPWHYGWQNKDVNFSTGCGRLAQWVDEVTAIINIPTLMDDNIMGLRGTLANLSFPLLKQPARLYINNGDPFIPEIYALPQIRPKVRLHIANALRILYYGGPQVQQKYLDENSSLIFSTDPVALDRIGLELIRRDRREFPLPRLAEVNIEVPYLQTAQTMGLGYQDLNFIEYRHIKMEKD